MQGDHKRPGGGLALVVTRPERPAMGAAAHRANCSLPITATRSTPLRLVADSTMANAE